MNERYTTSELIKYLDEIYYLVDGEFGSGDEPDKPKYEDIINRLLELDKIKKAKLTKIILDLEEFLNRKSDLFVSADRKVKIYRTARNIIRIDIKEDV